MPLKKWKLLSTKDVSPSKWFPIEARTYELPNGQIVEDFTVSTLADVAMIVPVTTDKKIVLVRQYKPGVNDIILQFPAGRIEHSHQNMTETAQHELEEETGIKVEKSQLHMFARLSGFSTKASEIVYFYLAENCEFNSQQHFDTTEDIEIVTLTVDEMDEKIANGDIWCAQTIAGWELVKKKFPTALLRSSLTRTMVSNQ